MMGQNSFFWAYDEMLYGNVINTWAKLHIFDIMDISFSENT